MNYAMVRCLVFKDWYLQRRVVAASLAASAVTLGVTATGGRLATQFGVIVLVTILISAGAQLTISSVINERKEHTLPFVMSLPVSYREYTMAKIVANMMMFLGLWLAVVGGSAAVVMLAPGWQHGLLPYVLIMGAELLVSICLMATVAITTESQSWTIAALMAGNLALNGFGYVIAHVPAIARTMWGTTVAWSGAATEILVVEFVLIGLLLLVAFWLQSRKTSFV